VPSADHFAAFGSQFILQTASDFAMFRFLDDTMNVLLDFATPNRFVEAFVDDASNGLPFSRLPSCLPLLQDLWSSWCRRNSLTAEITSAYLLFRSWLLGNGQRVVPTSQIYDAMETCARLTFWTEDEVNRAVQEEAAMRSERMENLCGQEEHHLEMPVSQPTSLRRRNADSAK